MPNQTENESFLPELNLSQATLDAFSLRDTADYIFKISKGLPAGLWKEKICLSPQGPESFQFFKSKETIDDLFSCLPSLIQLLEPDTNIFNFPLVEGSVTDYASEVDMIPSGEKPELQKIRFPAQDDASEEVLVERTFNSIRISFRFTAPHVALRSILTHFLATLHSSLQRTFAFRNAENLQTLPSQLSRPEGLPADADFIAACSDVFCSEAPTTANRDWVAVSICRKEPLKSFNLSLLILPHHTAIMTPHQICKAIWRVSLHSRLTIWLQILSGLQEAVLQAAKNTYGRCNMIGAAYTAAFQADLEKASRRQ